MAATLPAEQGQRFALRWARALRSGRHPGANSPSYVGGRAKPTPTPGPDLSRAGVAASGCAKQLALLRQDPEDCSGTTAQNAKDILYSIITRSDTSYTL